MTSYRAIQGVRDRMVPLQQSLRSAILADSTEEMSRHATDAMAVVDELLQALRMDGNREDAGAGGQADQALLRAAERALDQAWESAEKVSLAASVPDMRARILEFKTFADFADAYVSAALGTEL